MAIRVDAARFPGADDISRYEAETRQLIFDYYYDSWVSANETIRELREENERLNQEIDDYRHGRREVWEDE